MNVARLGTPRIHAAIRHVHYMRACVCASVPVCVSRYLYRTALRTHLNCLRGMTYCKRHNHK